MTRNSASLEYAARIAGPLAIVGAVFCAHAAAPSFVLWLGIVEIASGRAERGPWRQNDSKLDYVDDPAVAIGERGDVAVAWVDQARKAILFQRYSAEGKPQIAQPVDVSRHPATFSWLPRVVMAPDAPQKVFVLWQEIIFSGGSHGGDILFARSEDGGRTFGQSINLSRSVGGDGKGRINKDSWQNGSLDLVAGTGGVLYAAWTEYDGPLWFSRSLDGGKSFSPPARIARGDHPLPARAPSLALAPDRTLYLAWTVGDNDGADIHLARSSDGGQTFGPPQVIAPSTGHSDAPRLAVDHRGVVHLVYAESSAGPAATYHIRYARSTDGARTFEASKEISAPLPEGSASAAFPSLALDAQGRVYVTWELYRGARQPARGLALSFSVDGGGSFSRPLLVPHSVDATGGHNGSNQGFTKKLAVNASGALAIVNSTLKPDSHSRVWLLRGRVPG